MRISTCLSNLGISDTSPFAECDGISEEFNVIKKIYFAKILKEHPDKGGDAAVFRATRAAWQVLRDLYDQGSIKKDTFTSYLGGPTTRANNANVSYDENYDSSDNDDDNYDDDDDDEDLADLYKKYSANTSMPSYEYFAAAAEEAVPGYKVELAKSGRSTCTKCQSKIDKGGIRVGSLDKVSGTYGRWSRLECWRVPAKVQNGLTNPSNEQESLRDLLSMEEVLLTGVDALDDASKLLFVQHCRNIDHWANNRKRRQIRGESGSEQAVPSKSARVQSQPSPFSAAASFAAGSSTDGSNNIVAGIFTVLVPGVDGAIDDEKLLRGKTFLIAGMFPEVGGRDGDAVGVGNIKAMIQSFGGKVITRFSKNTNFLLVGRDAIASKFKDADKRSVDIISLDRLQGLLLGRVSFQELKNLPALTSDAFLGSIYQTAGVSPPSRGKGTPQVSATVSPASKAPAATAPTAKPKFKTKVDKSKPAAAKAASAVSVSTQAMVVRDKTNTGKSAASAIVPHAGKKAKFRILRPGVNGAIAGVLDGKRFVLTGVFPELGGGTGLTLGKDRTKGMIESFGGRVTSAVSGKTDFVLVGRDPGRSKVSQADQKGVPLVDLLSLSRLMLGHSTLEGVTNDPPPRITNFSAGYPGQKRIAY
mmetsp:Transcript_27345/g.51675  ORF Transcript_27345/g.51675 Transcript_27345/m.51675 type:complete len:644 (+) Transcript_27345:106-2037(+)